MTNEEKAKEIAYENNIFGRFIMDRIEATCLDMAQWKDEQFDKKLQEIVDYVYPLICGGERLRINEIIGKDMKWKH